MIVAGFGESVSPGNEQRNYWGSEAAKPTAAATRSASRSEHRRAGRAGDRGARSRAWWRACTRSTACCCGASTSSRNWYIACDRIAYWDKFGKPARRAEGGRADRRLVGRPGQGRRAREADRQAYAIDGRLHRPPAAAARSDAARDHAAQLRHRADRAGRAGRAGARAARQERRLGHRARVRRRRRALGARRRRAAGRDQLALPRRAGARPRVHPVSRSSSASTSRSGALRADDGQLPALRLRQELLPRPERRGAGDREDAGLDLARPLDDAAHLPDLDPARHREGGARRLALRRLDQRRGDRRQRDAELPLRDPAHRALRRRPLLRLVSAARARLRQLARPLLAGAHRATTSGTSCCRSCRW